MTKSSELLMDLAAASTVQGMLDEYADLLAEVKKPATARAVRALSLSHVARLKERAREAAQLRAALDQTTTTKETR